MSAWTYRSSDGKAARDYLISSGPVSLVRDPWGCFTASRPS